MRKSLLAITCLLSASMLQAQKDYTTLVNPFIGTGGHGHTFPGASMPFGMMQLSPDTRMADWDGSSGYHYSDSVIYGFSHTHLSGTGIPDYCDVLVMPFTGDVQWEKNAYRSGFSHRKEKASPGFYSVMLDRQQIQASLTTSYRSGMHQYVFPKGTKQGSILIDLQHRDEVLESWIEKISPTEIRGMRRSKSWAQNQVVYFYMQFDRPIEQWLIHDEGGIIRETEYAGSKEIKAAIRFNLPASQTLHVKVGISGVDADGAKRNALQEMAGWDFQSVRMKAKAAWNKELGKIEVSGSTHDQQVAFYTALYHTSLVPNIYQDVDGRYRGTDKLVHQAKGFTNYTVFSLWDTYRAYHPLMSIINRKRTTDWIQTFLAQYQYGGMLPVWELSANETYCMIGYHSVPVIADAWQKGIRGFDPTLALKAMRSYAESDRFGLNWYRKYGYLSNEKEHESVSKTLEYAYDDWCIAQFAKMTGQDAVYRNYIRRAQFYKNVYDPSTKHMRGKVQALWYEPFDPKEINNFYTEGNSWQYSFAVPQDMNTLMDLMGGREGFANQLHELFTTTSATTGREQADVTGLIGQYAQGNEPSHHMAYLFNFVGQPWRTQELVSKICATFYKNEPDGLIGNEDCGQMSAWYIMSAMGFYPVTPGNGQYVIGTPVFDLVRIHLENGKIFTIQSKRAAAGNVYVRSVKLNGKNLSHSWFNHSDLAKGGSLIFNLSSTPSSTWAVQPADCPQTRITDEPVVSAPYVDVKSYKFKNKMEVALKTIDPGTEILYRWKGKDSQFQKYTGPFIVSSSGELEMAAHRGDQYTTASQPFHRIAHDYTITVNSRVHPMYTAGGPEALIDGVEGTVNWRTGEWQSYFDQDFDAVIDLQSVKPVKYVGLHVLQDVRPWILYPSKITIMGSEDGKQYTSLAEIRNTAGTEEGPAVMQTMGSQVQATVRYIRIVASSGGRLPAWHESAGSPSHLFVDEIIVE